MPRSLPELWARLADGPGLDDVEELQRRFGFDDEIAELLAEHYPQQPVEVGQRRLWPDLAHVLDEDELAWPPTWLPLEPVTDDDVLVLAEGKVWRGSRSGEPRLSPEPLWGSFAAFLADVLTVREHESYVSMDSERWLAPEAERALRKALSPAAFDFFELPTLASLRHYLGGEQAAGRVVAAAGLFFLGCTVAFLFAPFGSLAARLPFVLVLGSVPFAIFLFGMRAVRRARRKLAALPPPTPAP